MHGEKFYITTAIDYPNSIPHMGHAYEKVVADFYARANRLRGRSTRFVIGLDEHGQKIQQAAASAGQSPQDFVDQKATSFSDLYALLNISNDDFIRTSEPRHHRFAIELYCKVQAQGDIYKGFYEGDYCVACEKSYTKSEIVSGNCPVHETPTTMIKEESYFFRLGKFRGPLRQHIESHPDFIYPPERRNEILARLDEEVLDLSVSRSTFDWGIPLADDPSHVLYVWFDALSNYISALKQPEDLYAKFWPAECHVIGKDIIWFHTVIWPAMLLSAGYPLPHQVYVHGFILDKDGRKMSKQLGNVVDPMEVVKEYSVDVLRFYFLRTFSSGLDGKFSIDDLEERYQSELGNDLGNLVLRIAKLVETRTGGTLSTPSNMAELDPAAAIREFFEHVDSRDHHRAVESLWIYVRQTNAYLNQKQPWKTTDEAALAATLSTGLGALRVIAHLASPIMPNVATSVAATLGFELSTISSLTEPVTCQVTRGPALFPRRDRPPKGEGGKDVEKKAKSPAPVKDAFAKLELRVGRIEEVRDHPDADSLYAMIVDLGTEKRSICAGLRAHVQAEDLRGRKVLVVANLKPAQLRGIESAGMVLAADRKDGKVVPVDPGDAALGDLVTAEGISSSPKAKLSKSAFEKAPLEVQGGKVVYQGRPLVSGTGFIVSDAEDGAKVR
jgi:methionyl-tRNA synthetase